LGVKILKFFDEDPGWRQFGSGINIPDPELWDPGSRTLEKKHYISCDPERFEKVDII
jgi:hypothetical protein